MESRRKVHSPQNISGASQQNSVVAFSRTAEVARTCCHPSLQWTAILIWKDVIYTLFVKSSVRADEVHNNGFGWAATGKISACSLGSCDLLRLAARCMVFLFKTLQLQRCFAAMVQKCSLDYGTSADFPWVWGDYDWIVIFGWLFPLMAYRAYIIHPFLVAWSVSKPLMCAQKYFSLSCCFW